MALENFQDKEEGIGEEKRVQIQKLSRKIIELFRKKGKRDLLIKHDDKLYPTLEIGRQANVLYISPEHAAKKKLTHEQIVIARIIHKPANVWEMFENFTKKEIKILITNDESKIGFKQEEQERE